MESHKKTPQWSLVLAPVSQLLVSLVASLSLARFLSLAIKLYLSQHWQVNSLNFNFKFTLQTHAVALLLFFALYYSLKMNFDLSWLIFERGKKWENTCGKVHPGPDLNQGQQGLCTCGTYTNQYAMWCTFSGILIVIHPQSLFGLAFVSPNRTYKLCSWAILGIAQEHSLIFKCVRFIYLFLFFCHQISWIGFFLCKSEKCINTSQ